MTDTNKRYTLKVTHRDGTETYEHTATDLDWALRTAKSDVKWESTKRATVTDTETNEVLFD